MAPSRTVVMQVNFKPLQPVELLLQSNSGGGERSRGQLIVRSQGSKGIEVYDVALKQPPAPSLSVGGSDSDSWFSWFPKFGVFGVVLLGVFIWNVCKYTGWGDSGGGGGEFDDAELEARIKEMAKQEGIDLSGTDFGGGSGGGLGASGGGGGLGMGNYDDD